MIGWPTGTFGKETFLAALERNHGSKRIVMEVVDQLGQCVNDNPSTSFAPEQKTKLLEQQGNFSFEFVF